MKRIVQTLLICLALYFLPACSPKTGLPPSITVSSSSGTVAVEFGEPFTIHVGQQAVVGPLQLVVIDLRDNRCPSLVLCTEIGFAQLTLEIGGGDGALQTYLMNSDPYYQPEMGVGTSYITHEGYRIELLDVSPYPELPEDDIPIDAYLLTFLITKEG